MKNWIKTSCCFFVFTTFISCKYENRHIIQGFPSEIHRLIGGLKKKDFVFISSKDTLKLQLVEIKADTLRLAPSFNYWFKEYPSSDLFLSFETEDRKSLVLLRYGIRSGWAFPVYDVELSFANCKSVAFGWNFWKSDMVYTLTTSCSDKVKSKDISAQIKNFIPAKIIDNEGRVWTSID